MPTTPDPFNPVALELVLADVSEYVRREFPQCSAGERRGMAAMRRMELVRGAAAGLPAEDPRRAALLGIAHAWLICGMALQRGRKKEVARAQLPDQWAVWLPNDVWVQWASQRTAVATEQEVVAFAEALWRLMQLPPQDLPKMLFT